MFKEYDNAWQRFITAKEAKNKTMSLIIAIIGGVVVFLIRKDFPLEFLVLLPALTLMFLVYFLHQSHAQSCAANSFSISEDKINQYSNLSENNEVNMDLNYRIRELRDGHKKYVFGYIVRVILIFSFIIGNFICLYYGLKQHNFPNFQKFSIITLNYILIFTIAWFHHKQNKERKKRFERMRELYV